MRAIVRRIAGLRPFYLNAGFVLLTLAFLACMDQVPINWELSAYGWIPLVVFPGLLIVTLWLTARQLPHPWWRDVLTLLFILALDYVAFGILGAMLFL